MAKKQDINAPVKNFKLITKTELKIILWVAAIIFLILCDKPYLFNDDFYIIKPFLWKDTEAGDTGIVFAAPVVSSGNANSGDKIVVENISDQAALYATPKAYILKRVREEQVKFEFQWDDVGPFDAGSGMEAYYFTYRPGGEYSGAMNMEVIFKKGDKMFKVAYRSNWSRFENNYDKALRMLEAFKIK